MSDNIQNIADGLTGLAAVIRKHGTCAPAALDELATRLSALAAQGGGVTIPAGTLVSVDVSVGEDDSDHRIFARATGEVMDRDDVEPVVLCIEESRNFASPPVPVERGEDHKCDEACYLWHNPAKPQPAAHAEEGARVTDARLTACIEGIALAKMALIKNDPVKAYERLNETSDKLDALKRAEKGEGNG
jgi:hypothetical protein